MLALILIAVLIAVIFAWYGKRNLAISFFSISFILAIINFIHHSTSTIGLSL